MERALEIAAKEIFSSWGGPWAIATEFRRQQARAEALQVFEVIRQDAKAASELTDFLCHQDMGDHSAA